MIIRITDVGCKKLTEEEVDLQSILMNTGNFSLATKLGYYQFY